MEHRAETVADFSMIYGRSLYDVAGDELWHLVGMLLRMTESWLHASASGWDRPISREEIVTADLRDNFVLANTDKKHRSRFKPWPRPWPDKSVEKIGGKSKRKRTPAEVRAILRPSL